MSNKKEINISLPGTSKGVAFNPIKKGDGADEVTRKGKYKRSGHLTDQMLKYNYPENKQPSLFDSLEAKTKESISTNGIESAELSIGIKLTPSEHKITDCLSKLLHQNSETSDVQNKNYYSGNDGFDIILYGNEKAPAPKLSFTLYELTREYKGGGNVSGKDVENVKKILTDLDNKRFLLIYKETTLTDKGGRIERKIEEYQKLVSISKESLTEFSKENVEINKQQEIKVSLNPIFRRQIDSKFINYPNDINKRTIEAYGSHNLSEMALRLRDYLIREHSSKRYSPEIDLERLYYLLAEKWMNESRKKRVKENTEKAIDLSLIHI